MFNVRNKRITFYVVQDELNPVNFLTLTCSKKDAIEFAYTYLKIQHIEHFKLWCDLRELDYNTEMAWELYSRKCITKEELKRYRIRKVSYTFNAVASMLRMFGRCNPIGCSFDTPTEYNYLKQKLETQKFANWFSNAINKSMAQNQNLEKEKEDNNGK